MQQTRCSVLMFSVAGIIMATCWDWPALQVHLHRGCQPGVGYRQGRFCLSQGLRLGPESCRSDEAEALVSPSWNTWICCWILCHFCWVLFCLPLQETAGTTSPPLLNRSWSRCVSAGRQSTPSTTTVKRQLSCSCWERISLQVSWCTGDLCFR